MIKFFKKLFKQKSFNKFLLGLILLVITIFFGFRSYLYLDPDFGWHLRLGEEILKKGVFKTDPFSYTMPSYQFIDHEWLINVLIYQISFLGKIPLSAIFALLPVAAFLILLPLRLSAAYILVILLSSSILLPYSGIRPQVVTWVFIGILSSLFENRKYWIKYSRFLPPLFTVWANLHGGFFIGIGVLTFFVIIKSIETKKIIRVDLVTLFLSLLATFVNPYGIYLWQEIWMQLTDPNLSSLIKEWLPLFVNFSIWQRLSLILFFAIFLTGIFLKSKKTPKTMLVIYLGLIIAAFISRRHIPIFVIGTSIFIFNFLKDFKKLTLVLGLLIIPISFNQNKMTIATSYTEMEDFNYPKNAISFLQQNETYGEIFTSYGWGGYLIWKLPQKKVFIDGRMPSWRRDEEVVDESKWVFQEFQQVLNDQNLEDILNKYQINQVVWPVKALYLEDSLEAKAILTGDQDLREKRGFIKHLLTLGWRQVYRDYITVILQRF